MIVLVCGGRNFRDYGEVARRLLDVHNERPITKVIHGGARGADSFADRWAKANNIPVEGFPADWRGNGKAAGPMRNDVMLAEGPDLVVAFPGGKGTAHMVRIARTAEIPVLEIRPANV